MTPPDLTPVLRNVFPNANFDLGDPALAIGSFPAWDSLAHFNLLLLVEETFGVRFSVDEMSELKSLAQIAARVAALTAAPAVAST